MLKIVKIVLCTLYEVLESLAVHVEPSRS